MPDKANKIAEFFKELKRRKVKGRDLCCGDALPEPDQ